MQVKEHLSNEKAGYLTPDLDQLFVDDVWSMSDKTWSEKVIFGACLRQLAKDIKLISKTC